MLEVNKDNFEKEVLQDEGLVVVDFWSPQCGPCKDMMPAVLKLAEKYGDKAKFCKLNIAENRRLAISQKVLGVPAVLFYKKGEMVAELNKDFYGSDVEKRLMELTQE